MNYPAPLIEVVANDIPNPFDENNECGASQAPKSSCKSLNISFKNNTKVTKDRTGKDFFYKLSSSKIRNELNWRPKIQLDEGISKVLNWYKLNQNKIRKSDTIYVHKK